MTALAPSHGSKTDVFINGYLMSQFFDSAGWAAARDKAEVSAFGNTNKAYVAGLIDSTFVLTGWFSAADGTQEDPVLFGVLGSNTDNNCLYAPQGGQGVVSFGDPAIALTAIETKYEVKGAINAANSISVEMQTDSAGGGVDRGYIYSGYATQSGAGNTSSINNGSATSNGGALVVHTFSDTASLVVSAYDSADNSTFAAVSGYSVSPTNATIGAYRYLGTGNIRQYTRINWTGTGTFVAFFSRK